MPGNNSPIFTKVGDIQGGATLLTQATTDYTGVSTNVIPVFTADVTNGGFVQRIRFKAVGTNAVTVARIWINEGTLNQASPITAPGTPSGSASTSGGTLYTGNFYAKVQAVDQWGGLSAASGENASAVAVTGPTGSITWSWTAPTPTSNGVPVSYRLYVGPAPSGEYSVFTTSTTSYTQTTAVLNNQLANPLDFVVNNMFYGEISLPATTAVASAATQEVDYPMNIALPPGYRILVGLGTTVAAGWAVTVIGGKY